MSIPNLNCASIQQPLMQKIIHCDFDCFYAAIETRDNPELQGKPLAIGGSAAHRGVIATCNYEARAYGIHSAMATFTALKKCPGLILIHPNMSKYQQVSRQAYQIFKQYSDVIETLSLDEAFLDVSHSTAFKGSATLIAQDLRKNIEQKLGITASAGIAPNKFLAKIASDWHKPNGQFVIEPKDVDAFVARLAIGKVYGVGKVTEQKMHRLGILTCADLRTLGKPELAQHFGKFGDRLYELCRGIDTRTVNTKRIRKSISVENTYTPDIKQLSEAIEKLIELEMELNERCAKLYERYQFSSLFVKVKFSDFTSTTVEKTFEANSLPVLQTGSELSALAHNLLQTAFKRKPLALRLIGIGFKLKPKPEADPAKQNTATQIGFEFYE